MNRTFLLFSFLVAACACIVGAQANSYFRFVHVAHSTYGTPLGVLSVVVANAGNEVLFNSVAFGTSVPTSCYQKYQSGALTLQIQSASGSVLYEMSLNAQPNKKYTLYAAGIQAFQMLGPESAPATNFITHTAYLSGSLPAVAITNPGNYVRSTFTAYASFGYFPNIEGESNKIYMSYKTNFTEDKFVNVAEYSNTPIQLLGPLVQAVSGDPNSLSKGVSTTAVISTFPAPSGVSPCAPATYCGVGVVSSPGLLETTPLSAEQYYLRFSGVDYEDITTLSMEIRGFITKSQSLHLTHDETVLVSQGRAVVRAVNMAPELGAVSIHVSSITDVPFIYNIERFSTQENSLTPGNYRVYLTNTDSLEAISFNNALYTDFNLAADKEYTVILYRAQDAALRTLVVQGCSAASALLHFGGIALISLVIAMLSFIMN